MNSGQNLYITNGDSAVDGLVSAEFDGVFLPIRDALHVGPLLPEDDFLSNDSPRCQFIIQEQWAPVEKVIQFQTERHEILQKVEQFNSIQLWFEHDLYDQLQLIWCLKYLAEKQVDPAKIKLVVTDLFLGYAHETDFFELLRFQEKASQEHCDVATEYWQRLTGSNPNGWLKMIECSNEYFPFVPQAILRFCQEFPSTENGLSLTAQRMLQSVNESNSAEDLFRLVQQQEQAVFMGDTQFYKVLHDLIHSPFPLLRKKQTERTTLHPGQIFEITELGNQVLEHKKHYLDLIDADFWLGGINIKVDNLWCYNDKDQRFTRRH